ncbi:MAG: Bug family tripartite tricarboxylate transporter substrate binding protein [Burkholderiaceae bacterium]
MSALLKASAVPRTRTGARLRVFFASVVAAGMGFVATSAQAQSAYPNAPVKLVVPFAPGGGTDFQARAIAKAMEPILKQTVVVENRPGAGGNIAARYVADAKPDGYTILVGSTGTHGTNEFLYPNLPYDPEKDFEPVSLISTFDNVVVVPATSSIKTLKELIDKAKAEPGKLNYGITTVGSSSHLAVEHFRREAGLNMQGIPYNGASLATTDLLGGRLDVMLDLVSTQLGSLQGGKVRPLATTGNERSPVLPDVPTVAESGYPGFSAIGWIGLFAPAGTPENALNTLHDALAKAYESTELRKSFESRGIAPATLTPKEYAKFLEDERKKWSTLIKEANIKIN